MKLSEEGEMLGMIEDRRRSIKVAPSDGTIKR